jgi:hypothetical protein
MGLQSVAVEIGMLSLAIILNSKVTDTYHDFERKTAGYKAVETVEKVLWSGDLA